MLAKTLVVFYVWSPDKCVLIFYHNPFSGIVYSIMSNKTLPYHIYNLYQDMCNYSQLKKIFKKNCATPLPPPPPPRGQWRP